MGLSSCLATWVFCHAFKFAYELLNLSSIVQKNGVYQTGEDDGFSTQVNRSRQYFGPVNIEKMRITLYDEYGRQIILNNMDWSCALMFECIYS